MPRSYSAVKNSYHKYKALDDIIEAPAGHWIYEEGTWWKYHGECVATFLTSLPPSLKQAN